MRSSHLLLGMLACVVASTSFAANRPSGYATICNEGKTCSVPANTQVAYGRADKFTFKILTGSFVCGEVTFGAGTKVPGGTNECSVPANTSAASSVNAVSSSSSKSSIATSVSSSAITASSRSSISSSITSSITTSTTTTSSVSYSSLPAGDGLVGWGTVHSDGLPTGGAGGNVCTATSLASLQACISTASSGNNKTIPWTIYVKGYIDGATNADTTGFTQLRINRDNTSLIGVVENGVIPSLNAVWITVGAYKNIIVRNIRFVSGKDTGWAYESFSKCIYVDKDFCPSNADPDSLTLQGTTRAWVDHNEFTDGADFNGVNANKAFYKMYDGLVDIKKGADFITLSYNKFSNHDKSILIGANDSVDGEYRITFYRNWFQYTGQRTPRVRNGQVHILNNVYEGVKRTTEDRPYHMTYVIGLGFNGKAFSERNAFDIQGASATQLLSANFDEWSQYFTDVGSWLNGSPVDLNAAAAEVINAQNAAEKASKPFLGPVTWAPGDYYGYSPVTDVEQLRQVVKTNAGVGKL